MPLTRSDASSWGNGGGILGCYQRGFWAVTYRGFRAIPAQAAQSPRSPVLRAVPAQSSRSPVLRAVPAQSPRSPVLRAVLAQSHAARSPRAVSCCAQSSHSPRAVPAQSADVKLSAAPVAQRAVGLCGWIIKTLREAWGGLLLN